MGAQFGMRMEMEVWLWMGLGLGFGMGTEEGFVVWMETRSSMRIRLGLGFRVGMGAGFGMRMILPLLPPCPCAQGGDRRVLPVHEPAEPAGGPALHDAQPLHGPGQATGDSAVPQPPDPFQRDLPVHPRLPPLLQRERRARGRSGERGEGAWLGRLYLGKPTLGMRLGKPHCGARGERLEVLQELCCIPGGGEGSAGGPGPGVTRCHPVLCLQEKEIMKELLENGPVQGKELAGTPQKCGGTIWGWQTALSRLGELSWEAEPPLSCSPCVPGHCCPSARHAAHPSGHRVAH